MEKEHNNSNLKDTILNFTKKNKKKFFLIFTIFFIFCSGLYYLNYKKKINNIIISEKYIQAGLYLSTNREDEAKNLYEDILSKKNVFYSTLALNTILEKNLESDKKKILKYFKTIEDLSNSKDQKDLIIFKKALYLLSVSDIDNGKKFLQKLIDSNSKLKSIAEEALIN